MKLDRVAGYFQKNELSDADLAIKLGASAHTQEPELVQEVKVQGCTQAEQCLAQFPVHRLVVFAADYFNAQVS
jgi:hypothetical protein